MTQPKSVSLADRVFEQLQGDILSGKYTPGEVLTETRLSEELGVSRTPVREAIRRLEQERLLQDCGKGMLVLDVSRDEASDIMNIRLLIEADAARRAATHMTPEQKQALMDAVELQEFYVARGNADHIQQQDNCFHRLVYEGCGSVALQSILERLHHRSQLYRLAAMTSPDRAAASAREHRAVAQAILDGDESEAAVQMTYHIAAAKEYFKANEKGK